MKVTIDSVYSREHFAAVNHIIKHYKKFNSLTEYFTYILDTLCNYKDMDVLHEISVLNPAYSKDSSDETDRKIMIQYKITESTINNKTKFQYDLSVNKIQEDMIATLEGSSFWDIGRIFDYLIYQILAITNTKTFKLPFNQADLETISSTNIYRRFDTLRQKYIGSTSKFKKHNLKKNNID